MNNTAAIYIFSRAAGLIIPEKMAQTTAANHGLPFTDRIEQDFGRFFDDGLFTAAGPDGRERVSVLLLPDRAPIGSNYRDIPLRALIDTNGFGYNRMLRVYHLAQWREESRFCGSCGTKNGEIRIDECSRVCPRCGRKEFPRISPAVLVLVTNSRGEALLARNNNFRENLYSLIAGFTEAGENLEYTAAREVYEETRVEIGRLQFVTSQSWPFPNSLMVGFEAEFKCGEIVCDRREIADARWFSRDNLPELPAAGSVSRYIIDRWLNGGEAGGNVS